MSNEPDARIIIDRLLREADWDIEDKAQVSTEEAAADGRADYVLKDSCLSNLDSFQTGGEYIASAIACIILISHNPSCSSNWLLQIRRRCDIHCA
jgi:hypothetical protein